jgi:outer membrane protein
MRFRICAAAAACFASTALAAPLPSPEEVANRDTLTIAASPVMLPDYDGSDDYHITPGAAARGRYHGIAFSTRGLSLYVDVSPRKGAKLDLEIGPIINARLERTGDVHDKIVKLLPERKAAIELGAFAGVGFHGLIDPYDRLGLRVDVVHDVAHAHRSTVISPSVEYTTPVSHKTYVGLSVSTDFASDKYANYYFTITPEDSALTRGVLPVFLAHGGIKDWKAGLLVDQSLAQNLLHGLSIFGIAQYSHLLGDFKRSPIVSDRGSAVQWVGATGLAYTW